MTRLISIATGRRPVTSRICFDALALQDRAAKEDTIVCVWAPPVDTHPFRQIVRPGLSKPEALNRTLDVWREETGERWPDVWVTMDDDIVIGQGALRALEAFLGEQENFWLVSAWNCGSQNFKGQLERYGDELVQVGISFCVGGAIHAIPRRALEAIGEYSENTSFYADDNYTARVLDAGKQVGILRSRVAVHLSDDGVDPDYRPETTEERQAKREALGLGAYEPDSASGLEDHR